MNDLLTLPLCGCAELAVNVQRCAHITNEGATKRPARAVMKPVFVYGGQYRSAAGAQVTQLRSPDMTAK